VALSDVAKAAGISQWHFQRIFKALTGGPLRSFRASRSRVQRRPHGELRVRQLAGTVRPAPHLRA
jgi:AraC-like DNA-binding protein